MRRFKETLVLGHRLWEFRFFSQQRLLSSFSNSTESVDDPEKENQVLVEGKGCSRTAILNRPSVLNALSTAMGAKLQKLYKCWEDDPDIGFVMMKGSGRAFCAGGDIVALYRLINRGNIEEGKNFFRTLYTFIYIVGTYLKPHVALLNGITMGGGAGVSIPGAFRVANDRTVFATPETLIGFHPDAGASFYLSHLPGHLGTSQRIIPFLGEYLALTGEKLNGTEMAACGLATHYTLSARLSLLEEHLGKLITDDFSVMETTLEKYGEIVYPDQSNFIHKIDLIDKCFGKDTVEEIIDSFEAMTAGMTDPWCSSALRKLREASPLSLKVSLRSIREGRSQTIDQCLIREYRMSLQGIAGHISSDFCEGVRAKMVDKDFAPKWDPPCFERVTEDMVEEYFSPLNGSEPDLELPIKVRGAFT